MVPPIAEPGTGLSRATEGPFPSGRCASARGLRRARYRVRSGHAVAVTQSEPSQMPVLNRTHGLVAVNDGGGASG
jgi:hypothetical protein